jgi:hypothetical protein
MGFSTRRAAPPLGKASPFIQLADAFSSRLDIHIASPVLRRELCATRRAMLAALREAELCDWMATGGDYLASAQAPNA